MKVTNFFRKKWKFELGAQQQQFVLLLSFRCQKGPELRVPAGEPRSQQRIFDIKRLFPRIKDVLLVKDYLEYSWTLLEKSSGVALSGSSSLAELGVFFDDQLHQDQLSSKEEGMETEEDGNNNKGGTTNKTPAVPSKQLKRRLLKLLDLRIRINLLRVQGFPTAPFLIHAPSPGDVGDRNGHHSAIKFGAPPPSSEGFIGFGLPPSSSGASPRNDSPSEAAQEEDKENEEPPKNEVIPVIEDDSVQSVRVGMTDNQYKGKGTLYIKMLSEGKFQLVVRADNNLERCCSTSSLTRDFPLIKSRPRMS
ncbi:Nuclear pore complex protein Nup50 [Orchesella cincta]|uniref:Nuclear pore complex protein Nup50 n=1 Tax=Orchesella cincta TaxID=48709 RepID=A0A1D2M2M6_ORCCI|nr:Nuclear pore complex protein Nup50 [Orchesella cincta]